MFGKYLLLFLFREALSEQLITCSSITTVCQCEELNCSFKELGINERLDIENNNKLWPGAPRDLVVLWDNNTHQIIVKWKGPNDSSIRDLKGFEIQLGLQALEIFFRFTLDIRNNSHNTLLSHTKTVFKINCTLTLDRLIHRLEKVNVYVNALPRPTMEMSEQGDCRCINGIVDVTKGELTPEELYNETATPQCLSTDPTTETYKFTTRSDVKIEVHTTNKNAIIAGIVIAFVGILSIVFAVIVITAKKDFFKCHSCNKRSDILNQNIAEDQRLELSTKKVIIVHITDLNQYETDAIKALTDYLSKHCMIEVVQEACSNTSAFDVPVDAVDFFVAVHSTIISHTLQENINVRISSVNNFINNRIPKNHHSKLIIVQFGFIDHVTSDIMYAARHYTLVSQLDKLVFHIHGLIDVSKTNLPWPADILETIEGRNLAASLEKCVHPNQNNFLHCTIDSTETGSDSSMRFISPSVSNEDITSDEIDYRIVNINEKYMNNLDTFDNKYTECVSIGGGCV